MVRISNALRLVAVASLLSQAVAHPGHDLSEEIAERNAFYKTSKRNLDHCDSPLRRRGLEQNQQQRRAAALEKARAVRGLPTQRSQPLQRDVTDESHLSTLDVTPTTSGVEDIIFANSTCLLSPEGEEGPYYVKGEYFRSDIRENQPGIDVVWDIQFISSETCEPIENLVSDIWHCNSTGVYAGVIATGNGNTDDTSNINKTYLRGLQTTDSEGVVQYSSIFPGYYSGRATHVHVEAHLNGSKLDNGTYTGGTIAHIGQFFFDQDLITEVNSLSPYSENTITLTENADDRVVQAEIVNDADPFLNYVLLGDSISDGLFMWVTIGVNPSATYTSSPASDLTADGGVAVGTSGGAPNGVNGNGTMGNGTMPSGVLSSGVVPSGIVASGVSGSVALPTSNGTYSASTVTSSALTAVSTSGAQRNGPFAFFL